MDAQARSSSTRELYKLGFEPGGFGHASPYDRQGGCGTLDHGSERYFNVRRDQTLLDNSGSRGFIGSDQGEWHGRLRLTYDD
jgi:hypothetical protein